MVRSRSAARIDLRVTILGANDVTVDDGKQKPDAYCIARILGRPHQELRTRVCSKSSEPVWDFTGRLERIAPDDLLEVAIYHSGKHESAVLICLKTLEYSVFSRGLNTELGMESQTRKAMTLALRIASTPSTYGKGDTRLFVRFLGAKDLSLQDVPHNNFYATASTSKWASDLKAFRTKVLFGQTSPEWDEEDEIEGYQAGDGLRIEVLNFNPDGADDLVGRVELESGDFHPQGFEGVLPLLGRGQLKFIVDVIAPVSAVQFVDPGAHIGLEDREPSPFQLRCLDTNRAHRILAYTLIGRSSKMLDPGIDLVLDSPGIIDVSRVHALIKAWRTIDPTQWTARIYDEQVRYPGIGQGQGAGHAPGGTSVDGEPVDKMIGTPIKPGSVIRFGIREMWVLEKAAMYKKSLASNIVGARAKANAVQDPYMMRELKIPSFACNDALQRCPDWLALVLAVLEERNEPDEPPCVNIIEIYDECDAKVATHHANTLESQETYNVRSILADLRLGTTIRMYLSQDPTLMAPILYKLKTQMKRMEALYSAKQETLHKDAQ